MLDTRVEHNGDDGKFASLTHPCSLTVSWFHAMHLIDGNSVVIGQKYKLRQHLIQSLAIGRYI
jgi:hypothetical protein